MDFGEALKKAKDGLPASANIHGDQCRLVYEERNPGCGLYKIEHSTNGRKHKDTILSEHIVDAKWTEQAPPKGLSLVDLVRELDDQP